MLNRNFIVFSEFLQKLDFKKESDQRFLCLQVSLIVFYLPTSQNSNVHAKALQKEVIELRKKGFQVFVVREKVWINKEELIKKMIQSKLQKRIAVFARDLSVHQINEQIANNFLKKNHLLGASRGRWYLALSIPPHRSFRFQHYSAGDVLGIAVFGKNIKRKKEGFEGMQSIEWVRFSTIPEIRIVGGLGKVFEKLFQMEKYDDIMTYVDIETNDSLGLQAFGFEVEEMTAPILIEEEFNLGNYKLRYVRS